jgi:hypothetical protein
MTQLTGCGRPGQAVISRAWPSAYRGFRPIPRSNLAERTVVRAPDIFLPASGRHRRLVVEVRSPGTARGLWPNEAVKLPVLRGPEAVAGG